MWRALLVAIALAAGCDDGANGIYDELPLDGDFTVGVSRPVHVVRDRFGVAHIDARTDLLDTYYLPETYFDAPYLTDEIIDAGETRWVFR